MKNGRRSICCNGCVFFNLTESYESSSYYGFDKRLGSYVSRR